LKAQNRYLIDFAQWSTGQQTVKGLRFFARNDSNFEKTIKNWLEKREKTDPTRNFNPDLTQ